jgi:hypothetical protein
LRRWRGEGGGEREGGREKGVETCFYVSMCYVCVSVRARAEEEEGGREQVDADMVRTMTTNQKKKNKEMGMR